VGQQTKQRRKKKEKMLTASKQDGNGKAVEEGDLKERKTNKKKSLKKGGQR